MSLRRRITNWLGVTNPITAVEGLGEHVQAATESKRTVDVNKILEGEMQMNAKQNNSLSITVDADTDKLQRKLRAIAKHTEALAVELDDIDNAWQCDCGSTSYVDYHTVERFIRRECEKCGEHYVVDDEDLPIRREVSD